MITKMKMQEKDEAGKRNGELEMGTKEGRFKKGKEKDGTGIVSAKDILVSSGTLEGAEVLRC